MKLRREVWLRGVDLNHRPLGYEPNELPDCSTPHSHPTSDYDVTSNTKRHSTMVHNGAIQLNEASTRRDPAVRRGPCTPFVFSRFHPPATPNRQSGYLQGLRPPSRHERYRLDRLLRHFS